MLVDDIQCRTDLPVLLITNVDPCWSAQLTQEYDAETSFLRNALIELGHPVQEVTVRSADMPEFLREFDPKEYLVLNWCEELPGIPHSEYRVAEYLEQMSFTFTGSDSSALYAGQDKNRIKQILRKNRIRTPVWKVFTAGEEITWNRFPAIVKAAFEHCSYGITRESVVQSKDELHKQVDFIFDEMQQPALVEEFIDGREFHVGVIGNGSVVVLPPAEIDYSECEDIHDRLCTYEANFDKDSQAYQRTSPRLPVSLPSSQLQKIEWLVLEAFRATRCRDYARMDIRLRDGTFYLLDVNHNADISSDTSLVLAAGLVGYSYGQFGSLLINLAAQRHPVFKKNINQINKRRK
jgi:D-alanine-D-alanine ligase